MKPDACPCGSGQPYGGCCGPCHAGAPAATAEALMRSRYSAYALGLERYLLDTWHPDTRPGRLELDRTPHTRWIGLEVRAAGDDTVEFVARCRVGGRAQRLHEISEFRREGGRWYYVTGRFPAD